MRRGYPVPLLGLLVAAGLGGPAPAQQVTVQTPFHAVNESFFERMGTSWNLNFPGGAVRFGGGNMGTPPFGNFDPSAGIRSGWGFRGGDLSGQFNFAAGQGFRRSMVSQTPMVTMMNGQSAYIGDTSQSPFVIGYIPVVGNYPTIPVMAAAPPSSSGVGSDAVRAALAQARSNGGAAPQVVEPAAPAHVAAPVPAQPRRQPAPAAPKDDLVLAGPPPAPAAAAPVVADRDSSAARAAPSVAEARRMHAAEAGGNSDEAAVYWERAVNAEKTGSLGAAKVYYQMAARRATGDLQQKALERLNALKSK